MNIPDNQGFTILYDVVLQDPSTDDLNKYIKYKWSNVQCPYYESSFEGSVPYQWSALMTMNRDRGNVNKTVRMYSTSGGKKGGLPGVFYQRMEGYEANGTYFKAPFDTAISMSFPWSALKDAGMSVFNSYSGTFESGTVYLIFDSETCLPASDIYPDLDFPPPPDDFDGDDMAQCCDQVQADLALLKLQVKEIHQSLQATKYSKDDDAPGQARVANLGYYVERIARVLGISVNSNGTIRSIRQKKVIKKGNSIPAGWAFGQWGQNTGGNAAGQEGGESSHYKDGIVYEQRSNEALVNEFNPSGPTAEIKQGNYVLCENLPQYIDEMLDDLDKGLGWQELGAYVVPNADGSGKHFAFEGLSQLLIEMAYSISRISQHTAQTQVSTLIVQAVCHEILKSTGQPLVPRSFRVDVGGTGPVSVPFPALAQDAPSQITQTSWLLQTLAPILGYVTKLAPPETSPNSDPISLEDLINKLLNP